MSKVWLITGCSRGLGRELAQAVLAAGHHLVATARDPRDLAFLPPGDRLRTVALDVTDPAAARAAVAVATTAFGHLDVVVNNAGYIRANSVEDLPEDDFRRQFEIDFFGVYNVTRAALPVMHAQRDGHIIQISSIGGRRATPGLGAYQSAKWAVGGFSEVLAREVTPLGIRVTCVEPGGMRTEMYSLSMLDHPIASDYEATVGTVIRATFGSVDRARGNPVKVAQAILKLAEERQPPVRLLIGSDAVSGAAAAAAARAEEDARWKALSVSTDFDGVGDVATTGGSSGRGATSAGGQLAPVPTRTPRMGLVAPSDGSVPHGAPDAACGFGVCDAHGGLSAGAGSPRVRAGSPPDVASSTSCPSKTGRRSARGASTRSGSRERGTPSS